ncbi:MAG: thiolase family protein [Natronomonas sp.]
MDDTTPVVVAACRTPLGKADGVFADVRPEELSIPLVDHLLAETGLDGESVDDLLWGCAGQRGPQGNNLARVIALCSTLGESTPAATINRWCASSAQAIAQAADAIRAGRQDCVVAGGVESMSMVPIGGNTDFAPLLAERYDLADLRMGATAEAVAERYGVSRREQDEYAARSQQRASAATDDGRFAEEIVPIEGRVDGETRLVAEDEGLRRDTTIEGLGELDPVFAENGTVTAGNASQTTDGAAGLLVVSAEFADENGLEPMAIVGESAVAGVDPEVMGIGPVPACRRLFERTETTADDYDLVELNEAFASQTVYCRRELGFESGFNVNGGAIAIGHPLGATGARLPVTLLYEMHRRGADRGLATECVGFGQGMAIAFEQR